MEGLLASRVAEIDDPEYDTEEAARFLGCSPGYLSNLRSFGSGPTFHRKFKRRGIFYLRSDLQAYRLRNSYTSTTEY
jgi:hypothetical protein